MDVGRCIEECRKKKGLTQQQLSELCGIPTISIGRYERGERNPDIESTKKIADALDIDISNLLEERELTPGELIKKHRLSKSLSRKELAKQIGISVQALANYENGHRFPKKEHAITLSCVLGISIDELYDSNLKVNLVLETLKDDELIKELLKRGYRVFKEYKEGEF